MDIHKITRKLRSARYEAKKQSDIADDLSREIVQLMRKQLKESRTTLALVSQSSGIPRTQLVNWLSGYMGHALPPDKVTEIWKAIKPQKASYTHQLQHLSEAEWQAKDNRTIAQEIGCSIGHVQVMRKRRESDAKTLSTWGEFLKTL